MNKLFRGVKKVRCMLTGYQREREATFRNAHFYARCSDHIGKRLLLDGGYEHQEVDYLLAMVDREDFDAFLDIGACFGLYTQVIAANSRIPRLHAFEPDPNNAQLLERICVLNQNTDRVRLWRHGVSDRDSVAMLRSQADCVGNSSIVDGLEGEGGEQVHLIRLDDHLEFSGSKLLVKMDVENHERFALKGMERLLRENRVFMQVEIFEDNFTVVDALLRAAGLHQVNRIRSNYYYSNMLPAEG